ncbi:SufD family Fe-S cluster assembly protein [Acidaminobacter sp. JC074]|uniref:SufB/SufD family protein n=1 Tax=Acidaminobacter sp. JC074 TaxID=2530199 RepID=UPI001F10826B|nr:SufD family Fe-S cluster assembly protein [Acidaminobacter sp. JC074]MCH4885980.1 SufD family Fe-S cluster assembly protein [Acidaminobacter sp. JC074]
MTLKEVGIDFKRVPLPEYVASIDAETYTPEIIKGQKNVIHDIKKVIKHQRDFRKALGNDYESFVKYKAGTKLNIHIKGDDDFVWLNYKDHAHIVEENHIHVEAYKKGTVVMVYENEKDFVHHGLTRIVVEEGGTLNLIKIQNTHLESQFVDHVLTEVHDRGTFKAVDLQIGSKNMIINYDTNLLGYQSECDYKSMYMAADDRGLDLSFTANHIGKKSQSDILGKGVLNGKSKKVFRGTLHFERGAVGSAGKEEEFVLLLSDDVKADSIPALMCTEDDVIGEHGASIGQLDEDRLFYLMSRGLSEHQAKLLVIQSSFKEIIEEISDEDTKILANEIVDRSIEHVI